MTEDDLKVKIGRGANDCTEGLVLPLGRVPRGLRGGVGGAGRVEGNTRETRATLDDAKTASRTGQKRHSPVLPLGKVTTRENWHIAILARLSDISGGHP